MDSAESNTRDLILETAAALLRRHGPAKLTILDVARRLGMSHGNVYRHFASKQALRAAVAEAWLGAVTGPLASIAADQTPPPERFAAWLRSLAAIKRRKVLDDPEMFAGFHRVAKESPDVIARHVGELTRQMSDILAAGRADGSLPGVEDATADAMAALNATLRFHHPDLVAGLADEATEMKAMDSLLRLLLKGLGAA